jgi:hypothetical protein
VRTGRLLEPLSNRAPFLRAAAKSSLAHADHAPAKSLILPARQSAG